MEEPMAWEMRLLRNTKLRSYGLCLDVLEGYADRAPWWQRGCLFLYTALGTWIASLLGFDMEVMWTMGEMVVGDAVAVTRLTPREIARELGRFVKAKRRNSAPLDFGEAKAAVYDQAFWPMAAHMAFAVQPSAIVRRHFVARVADSVPLEHAHVADLGCGPGVILCNVLRRKAGWTGEGLDISQAAIDYATRLAAHQKVGKRVRFSTGDVVHLPYRDASFDVVIASEVLEHVPDIQKALAEIRRVLRPGGTVVITVPLESRTALHVHSLAGQEYIERLCRQAGFIVRRLETLPYLGFGDDWRHAFLVAEATSTSLRNCWQPRPTSTPKQRTVKQP
jgi:ubiquinone/menaquinone biosynthesis C-methylase UbiE